MNAFIEQLNRWGETAVPFATQLLWQTSLLIVVLLAVDLLLRNRVRAGFRYALWMLLLIKLVLPPSLALPTGAGYWIDRPVKEASRPKPVITTPKFEITHPTATADSSVFEDIQGYEGLALSEVVKELSDEVARRDRDPEGIKFIVVSQTDKTFATDQTTGAPVPIKTEGHDGDLPDAGSFVIDLNPGLTNITLNDALNAVCLASDHPLQYAVEDFGVLFSRKVARAEPLETRAFRVRPDMFYQGLQSFLTNSTSARPSGDETGNGGARTQTRTNDLSAINRAVRACFEAAGVRLLPPKMLFYNDRTGMLFVKATHQDLIIIENTVAALNFETPQIELEARVVELSPEAIKALSADLPADLSPVLLPETKSESQGTGLVEATVSMILPTKQAEAIQAAINSRSNLVETTGPLRVTTVSGERASFKAARSINVVNSMTNTPTGRAYGTNDFETGDFWEVLPKVSADGYTVNLAARFERIEFLGYDDSSATGKPLPHFDHKTAEANVMVWDGQTLVLGGMTVDQTLIYKDKVPVLGDLPWAGRLFRKEGKSTKTRHVLTFITTRLVDPAGNQVHTEVPFARETVPVQSATK